MNVCIFIFRFKLNETQKRVVEVLNTFHSQYRIKKISSVFKKTTPSATRMDEEMSFAALAETASDTKSLLAAKSALEGPDFKFQLVAFNNEINWTPDLTLPSPLLNFDPLVLHCCAEIAPDYVHPILKEELRALDINNIKTDFEFLFQGKIYIDQLRQPSLR